MNLRDNETIYKIVRKHWVDLLSMVVVTALVITVVIMANIYVNFNFFGYNWQVYYSILAIVFIVDAYLVIVWRLNLVCVTNQRIVYQRQLSLFNRRVTEVLYNDISDVTFSQNGPLAMSFNFGDISIRTIGDADVSFGMVPEPERVIELINQIKLEISNGSINPKI
ncbi:MAG: hypothetical protein UT53_C0005G0013 [Candidatus Yanofskybacteria bacterium GW2011_GWD2_39_48]|uniref:YdbS-like PH domain-containing protein n=1 Tax=Candidatus Yanofskybacteria bacterium GW2011_GWD2_39_48 TaxID=1619031 RepID=A0A0G0SDW8_9BACT|nr:MAG: hypothetical protein UT53_C0005G0013 [Candidatus Yanofskybacteria bacterium GW2011_GWD2_39_48]